MIATKVSLGGNLVYAVSFFRNGASYYKVNEKIDTSSLSLEEISSLSLEQIITIARSVCHSVGILHDIKIVHGDLKPDNILIKETSRDIYSGKLIDFDDSYFSENPPSNRENIVGTPEYYSPELAAYIMDEDEEIEGKTLTLASDVFTLGIIFCEYFTGKKPVTGSSLPTWSAVTKGCSISFAKTIKPEIEDLLRSMLSLKAEKRPSVKEIQYQLKEIKERGTSSKSTTSSTSETPPTSTQPKVGLRGKILTNADRDTSPEPTTPSTSKIPPTPTQPKVDLRGIILNDADK